MNKMESFTTFFHLHITGVANCNPSDSSWTGYSESCCSSANPCGVQQGGCSSDNQCSGQLVCGTNTDNQCGGSFTTSQKCCHQKGTYNQLKHTIIKNSFACYIKIHTVVNFF